MIEMKPWSKEDFKRAGYEEGTPVVVHPEILIVVPEPVLEGQDMVQEDVKAVEVTFEDFELEGRRMQWRIERHGY